MGQKHRTKLEGILLANQGAEFVAVGRHCLATSLGDFYKIQVRVLRVESNMRRILKENRKLKERLDAK